MNKSNIVYFKNSLIFYLLLNSLNMKVSNKKPISKQIIRSSCK